MPLLARMVESPLIVEIRAGAIERLADVLSDARISICGRVALAVGPGQGEQIIERVGPQLTDAEVVKVTDGTVDEARDIAEWLRGSASYFDAVVGIGGGRTIDVAKYAASLVGLPMVSVPTSLAHDGLASPVASLDHNGHKGSSGVHIPIAVVVDLDYVRRGEARWIRAGIGDAVSNLSALADWSLAAAEQGEPMDGLAAAMARSGAEAVLHHTEKIDSVRFLHTLAEALVLSGLAMAIAGTSRPCSGACHEISHAIDAMFPGKASHGEQVAVGALFASYLRQDGLAEPIDECLRRHSVPRLPGDIGLTTEEFCAAVHAAPDTRPDRYTILEHLRLSEDEIRKHVHVFNETFHR